MKYIIDLHYAIALGIMFSFPFHPIRDNQTTSKELCMCTALFDLAPYEGREVALGFLCSSSHGEFFFSV
jgi:hypothetical protein